MRATLTGGGDIQLGRLMNQTPVYHFDDAGVLIGEVGAPRLVRLAFLSLCLPLSRSLRLSLSTV